MQYMQQQNIRLLATSVLASLAFVFCMVVGKAQATPCEAEPTDMSVGYGERIECDITPGTDTDVYRFSGVTGDRILAEAVWVSGGSFNPRIKLIAPDGSVLGDTWSPARLDIVLSQAGIYTAIISDDGSFYAGGYAFTVSCTAGLCLPPSPPDPPEGNIDCGLESTDMFVAYGTRVTCDITPGTDTDLYRFSGGTGDRILAEAVWKSGGSYNPRIKLIAPNGATLGDTWSPARLDVVLPQTGVYTAIISDDGSFYAGEYAFTVSCTGGTCLLPSPPCPPISDQDEDGEVDPTDACPNTPSGQAVDQAGCSLEQFCNAIDATTAKGGQACKKADWQNDEPLMKGSEADCKVDRGGSGAADDLCVPN